MPPDFLGSECNTTSSASSVLFHLTKYFGAAKKTDFVLQRSGKRKRTRFVQERPIHPDCQSLVSMKERRLTFSSDLNAKETSALVKRKAEQVVSAGVAF